MEFTETGFPEPTDLYLQPTHFLDFDNPSVRAFAERAADGASTELDRAVKLFYAVRDEIRYDPYRISNDPETYRASDVVAKKAGFCIPKAVLLTACARACGIHAGIGLSDVTNHLCSERLLEIVDGKDLFIHHGYAAMYIDGAWVKAAPAFNIGLCDKFGVTPSEFDGRSHALLQEFDRDGRRHMEYRRDHGIWSELPMDRILGDFADFYSNAVFEKCAAAVAANDAKQAAQFEDERPLT